jgi:hypothetical protein
VLAPFALPAQDAAPDTGAPSAEPTPAVPADAPAEETLVAPGDATPSEASETPRGDAAAAAAATVDGPPADPPAAAAEAAAPESRPSVDDPIPPPPAPSVDVAAGSLATVEEVSAGRVSNWFFLAVLALAFVLIATRVRRTTGETVSIQEERSAPAPPPVPPIVRRS